MQSIIFIFAMDQLRKQIRRVLIILVFGGFLTWIIASCAPQVNQPISELFSPTPTLTTTPTVLWFPATNTPSLILLPTSTPNPAANPIYGAVLFNDTFSSAGNWQNSQNTNGNIIITDNSLTLAVNAARGSLSTIRQNTTLNDFYLETTATIHLCKQDDQIGILFRVEGSQSYYRMLINCQGTYALQQVLGGAPAFLANWTPSAELQPGLYQPLKIGIWAYGNVLRIYFNDQLQSEVSRGTFQSGSIGFYARAAADTPLTVSFSDLTVYQVNKNSISLSTPSSTP